MNAKEYGFASPWCGPIHMTGQPCLAARRRVAFFPSQIEILATSLTIRSIRSHGQQLFLQLLPASPSVGVAFFMVRASRPFLQLLLGAVWWWLRCSSDPLPCCNSSHHWNCQVFALTFDFKQWPGWGFSMETVRGRIRTPGISWSHFVVTQNSQEYVISTALMVVVPLGLPLGSMAACMPTWLRIFQ